MIRAISDLSLFLQGRCTQRGAHVSLTARLSTDLERHIYTCPVELFINKSKMMLQCRSKVTVFFFGGGGGGGGNHELLGGFRWHAPPDDFEI